MQGTLTTRWRTDVRRLRHEGSTVHVDPLGVRPREGTLYVAGTLSRGLGFVGPGGEGRDGCVCTLDRATGDVEWGYVVDGPVAQWLFAVGDERVVTTGRKPAEVHAVDRATGGREWRVERDGRVLALTLADGTPVVSEADGTVAGLGADGSESWTAAVTAGARHLVASGDAASGDVVVAGDAAGGVTGLAAASGERRWHHDLPGEVTALATHRGTVYVGTDGGRLLALDGADGSERWRTSPGATVRRLAPTGPACHAVVEGEVTRLDAYAAGGDRTFTRRLPDALLFHPPAVVDGTAYVVDGRGTSGWHVLGLDATDGTEQLRWSPDETEYWRARAPPTADGDLLFVGDRQGLHALGRP